MISRTEPSNKPPRVDAAVCRLGRYASLLFHLAECSVKGLSKIASLFGLQVRTRKNITGTGRPVLAYNLNVVGAHSFLRKAIFFIFF